MGFLSFTLIYLCICMHFETQLPVYFGQVTRKISRGKAIRYLRLNQRRVYLIPVAASLNPILKLHSSDSG